MPSHPPDSQFYKADGTYTLWRDLTRLFEDFCGDDPSQWPDRRERFKVVAEDVLARLAESQSNYDICPKCGAPALEPDGKEFNVLHCSKCDWDIGIRVIQGTAT